MTTVSDMLYQLGGVPVGGAFTTGNVFFVDSGASLAGDNVSSGKTPGAPFATIDYAVGMCTANNGDIIYVMPGHAEVVTAAAGLALDVAGISIIGIGRGTDQPTVTLTTADTADVDVDAANILIENINFVAGFADIAVMIDVNATDCTIRNCRFTQSAVDLNALVCIEDALLLASNRLTVEGCYALMYDAANTHFVNFVGTGDGYIIRNNILIGDWGTMAVGGAGIVTYVTIMDNVISNQANTNDGCINLDTGSTGIVMRNLCAGAAAQANGITATACAVAENYYGVVSEDLSAILDPIAT